MKHFHAISLLAVSLFVADLAAAQPTGAVDVSEAAGPQTQPPSTGPIVVNWKMKKVDGTANLMVNPDGTYLFSGTVKDKKPGKDFDISIALKSTAGGIIVFHFMGDESNGVQWSKQGQSDILKSDFATFAGKHDWDGSYRYFLNSEGKAKLYEAQEKKKAELRRARDAAKQAHDDKLAAEKDAEIIKEQQQEIAQANAAINAANHHSGGGGGGGIGGFVSGAVSSIGDVVGDIGSSVGNALSSIF